MNLLKKSFVGAAVLASLASAGTAFANVIDLFDDPILNDVNVAERRSSAGLGTTVQQFGPSASIIGGYRDLVSTLVSSDGIGTAVVRSEVGGGGYSFSTTSGDRGIGRVQWDGVEGTAALDKTGLGGLNLIHQEGCPIAGCTQFAAVVTQADQGFEYQIGVYTDATNYSILTSNTLPAAFPEIATYDFVWFQLATGDYFLGGLPFHIDNFGAGPDFTNIGALELVVNSDAQTTAVDLSLDMIIKRGVPEPGTLALLGIGLIGVGAAARKRKAAAA